MKTQLLIITALESELKRDALPQGVEIVYCGVGKLNAAITTINAINQFVPKRLLNFGTVGKVNPKLKGLLEIDKVIQRDMIAEPLIPRGQTPFCSHPHEYFSESFPDSFSQSAFEEVRHVCGTGDSFVNASDPWLLDQGIDVVDMELFAIARVAHQKNIPWQSFKYITDDANEDSGKDWQERVNHGQELFLKALKEIFNSAVE